MANVRIGDLPSTSSLASTDIIPSVAIGPDVTYKITVQGLANSLTQVSSSISASYALTASYALNSGAGSGTSGTAGSSGTSGTSGSSGTSGTSGSAGSSGSSGTSGTGFNTVSNFADNRVLTSDGTSNQATAETNFTFNGNLALLTGSLIVSGTNGAGVFSQGITMIDYVSGISTSGSYKAWRAPFSCSVVGLYGYRLSGTTANINAARSGSTGFGLHSASDVALSSDNVWTAASTIQNANYNIGDSLQIIISGSGNSQIAVQVDFIKKV